MLTMEWNCSTKYTSSGECERVISASLFNCSFALLYLLWFQCCWNKIILLIIQMYNEIYRNTAVISQRAHFLTFSVQFIFLFDQICQYIGISQSYSVHTLCKNVKSHLPCVKEFAEWLYSKKIIKLFLSWKYLYYNQHTAVFHWSN